MSGSKADIAACWSCQGMEVLCPSFFSWAMDSTTTQCKWPHSIRGRITLAAGSPSYRSPQTTWPGASTSQCPYHSDFRVETFMVCLIQELFHHLERSHQQTVLVVVSGTVLLIRRQGYPVSAFAIQHQTQKSKVEKLKQFELTFHNSGRFRIADGISFSFPSLFCSVYKVAVFQKAHHKQAFTQTPSE